MPTTSELACSTATKTLARPSRMVIVCVMSVPHISLTLSVMIVPSCGLVSVRPTRCGGFQPGDVVISVIAFAFFQGCSRACERTLAPLGQPGDRDIRLPRHQFQRLPPRTPGAPLHSLV